MEAIGVGERLRKAREARGLSLDAVAASTHIRERYLEALEANRPKRGRKRSQESIEKRLAEIDAQIATADPLKRVNLINSDAALPAVQLFV